MNELSVQLLNIKMEKGYKELFEVKNLSVYNYERIVVIGDNGVGKTTLLQMISGDEKPVEGTINKMVEFGYYRQATTYRNEIGYKSADSELIGKFNIPLFGLETLSGGEFSKLRIAQVINENKTGIILDEPTSHMDKKSIDILIDELRDFYGPIIFTSHDRYFINKLADKVWEISNGKITEYVGNYNDYQYQKDILKRELERNIEKADKERSRLEESIEVRKEKALSIMNVSESKKKRNIKPNRLAATKQKDSVQKSMLKTVKSMTKKLDLLDIYEPEFKTPDIIFPKTHEVMQHNHFPIVGENVTVKFSNKTLLEDISFQFPLGKKIAIVGDNGIGKTSFLKYIIKEKPGITISKTSLISINKQLSYEGVGDQSIIDYLRKIESYPERLIRNLLINLGFKNSDLKRSIKTLSGGEMIRLSLGVTLAKRSNILVLDEPTTFLDIRTIKSFTKILGKYSGTVLFTSHDQYFVKETANIIYKIENKKLFLVES